MPESAAETLTRAVERLSLAATYARTGGGFVRLTADEAIDLAMLLEHVADNWNSRDFGGIRDDALTFARTYLDAASDA